MAAVTPTLPSVLWWRHNSTFIAGPVAESYRTPWQQLSIRRLTTRSNEFCRCLPPWVAKKCSHATMIKNRTSFMRHFNFSAPSPTRFPLREGLSASAVLIALVEHHDKLEVVFTQRTSHLRHHAGEICFPG